jgi:hypothetical protein
VTAVVARDVRTPINAPCTFWSVIVGSFDIWLHGMILVTWTWWPFSITGIVALHDCVDAPTLLEPPASTMDKDVEEETAVVLIFADTI